MYDKQELEHRKKTKSNGPEGKTRINSLWYNNNKYWHDRKNSLSKMLNV